jgi:Nitrile hydratase, alpha chain
MTTSSESGTADDAQQRIVDRAMRDPDFRARLLENPQQAIQEELGTSLTTATTIRVVEEQPGEVVLVLPARPMESGMTLSDEELEGAAGGSTISIGAPPGSMCEC